MYICSIHLSTILHIHTHIYICMVFVFFRNIRVASRREPPAPRELGREERSRRTWPNQSRLGSSLAVLGPLSWDEQERIWAQLGLTCAELGPVGSNLGPTWAQHVALNPQNWLGRAALKQLGPKLRVGASWSCWAEVGPQANHVMHMEVRVSSNMP